MRKRQFLFAALVLVLPAVLLAAADIPKDRITEGQKREAVTLVRSINTAEYQYKAKSGKFATVSELVHTGLIQVNDPGQPLPEFRLRVMLASDGNQYQLALIHSTHWALFSDEQGLIYIGEAMR
jgi:hypothetical protein